MPTSLNGVIDNTTIKIGKTLNLYISAEHAIAGTPVAGTVPPQIAIAWDVGGFSARSWTWPAVAIKFNQTGQTGYWASGWINTATNLPLADPSTVTLGAIQLADAAMTLPLTVTPQSTGVVHDVAVSVWNGSTWTAIKSWTGVAAGTTWSLTQTNVRSMLTVFSGAGPYRVRVVVVTKKDGTTVGTSTKEVSATMASSLAPSVGGYQLTDAYPASAALNLGSVGATKYFVQGLSVPKITLTGGVYPAYGAYLSKIEVKQDNKVVYTSTRPANDSGTSAPIELFVSQDLSKTGASAISVSVIDTRGVKASGALAANFLPYSAPTLTNLQVRRASDTSGTLDEAGTYIRIDGYTSRSALTVNSVDKNSATLKIYVKEKSVAEFSETPFNSRAVAAGSASQSYTIATAIDSNKSYDIMVVLEDGLNQTGQTLTLATQKVPFSIGKDEGVGAGKIWEAGALDIASHDGTTGGVAIDGVLQDPWPWLSSQGLIATGTNFNTLKDGKYFYFPDSGPFTNAPNTGSGMLVCQTMTSGGVTLKTQQLWSIEGLRSRYHQQGTWYPWTKVYTDLDPPTTDPSDMQAWVTQQLNSHAGTTGGVHGIPANAKYTDTTYSAATTSTAGLMSSTDKTKLNGIATGAQVNPGAATTSAAGLMSAADKTKLNGIAAGAQVNPTNISAFTNNVGYQTAAQVTAAINSNIIGSGNASGVVFNQNLVNDSLYILYIGRDASMYVVSTSSGVVRILAIAAMANVGSISTTGGLNFKIDFSTRARPWILTKVL